MEGGSAVSFRNYPAAGRARPPAHPLQWPLAGVAVLLVVLILVTPELFANTSGGLQTRAQLIVDRAPSANATSYYVESIGTATRYQSITIGLATLPSWPYLGTVANITRWSWTNGSNTLVVAVTNGSSPVAVNVTVMYTDPSGATTEYGGVYGFYLNATSQRLETLPLNPGTTVAPTSTPLGNLPIFLLLSVLSSKGVP
jgi:hypothetical protein